MMNTDDITDNPSRFLYYADCPFDDCLAKNCILVYRISDGTKSGICLRCGKSTRTPPKFEEDYIPRMTFGDKFYYFILGAAVMGVLAVLLTST